MVDLKDSILHVQQSLLVSTRKKHKSSKFVQVHAIYFLKTDYKYHTLKR